MPYYDDEQVVCEDIKPEHFAVPNAWMVRPCEWYTDELWECRKLRSRFHQYFIFGKLLDCGQWAQDAAHCKKYRASGDIDSLVSKRIISV